MVRRHWRTKGAAILSELRTSKKEQYTDIVKRTVAAARRTLQKIFTSWHAFSAEMGARRRAVEFAVLKRRIGFIEGMLWRRLQLKRQTRASVLRDTGPRLTSVLTKYKVSRWDWAHLLAALHHEMCIADPQCEVHRSLHVGHQDPITVAAAVALRLMGHANNPDESGGPDWPKNTDRAATAPALDKEEVAAHAFKKAERRLWRLTGVRVEGSTLHPALVHLLASSELHARVQVPPAPTPIDDDGNRSATNSVTGVRTKEQGRVLVGPKSMEKVMSETSPRPTSPSRNDDSSTVMSSVGGGGGDLSVSNASETRITTMHNNGTAMDPTKLEHSSDAHETSALNEEEEVIQSSLSKPPSPSPGAEAKAPQVLRPYTGKPTIKVGNGRGEDPAEVLAAKDKAARDEDRRVHRCLTLPLWQFLGECGAFFDACAAAQAARLATQNQAEERQLLSAFVDRVLGTRQAHLPKHDLPILGGEEAGTRSAATDAASSSGGAPFWRWLHEWELCPACYQMATHPTGEGHGVVDWSAGLPRNPPKQCPHCRHPFTVRHRSDTSATAERMRANSRDHNGSGFGGVSSAKDLDEPFHALVLHAALAVLSPVGSWRRNGIGHGPKVAAAKEAASATGRGATAGTGERNHTATEHTRAAEQVQQKHKLLATIWASAVALAGPLVERLASGGVKTVADLARPGAQIFVLAGEAKLRQDGGHGSVSSAGVSRERGKGKSGATASAMAFTVSAESDAVLSKTLQFVALLDSLLLERQQHERHAARMEMAAPPTLRDGRRAQQAVAVRAAASTAGALERETVATMRPPQPFPGGGDASQRYDVRTGRSLPHPASSAASFDASSMSSWDQQSWAPLSLGPVTWQDKTREGGTGRGKVSGDNFMLTSSTERMRNSNAQGVHTSGSRDLRASSRLTPSSSSSSRPMPRTPQLAHTRAGFKVPGMQETLGALAAEPLPSSSSSSSSSSGYPGPDPRPPPYGAQQARDHRHYHDRELSKTPQSAMRQYLFVEKERLSSSQPVTQPRRKNQGSTSRSKTLAAAAVSASQPPSAAAAPAVATATQPKKRGSGEGAKRRGGGMFDGAEYRVRPLARGLYG